MSAIEPGKHTEVRELVDAALIMMASGRFDIASQRLSKASDVLMGMHNAKLDAEDEAARAAEVTA